MDYHYYNSLGFGGPVPPILSGQPPPVSNADGFPNFVSQINGRSPITPVSTPVMLPYGSLPFQQYGK